MVRLIETSSVNAQKFPVLSHWDTKVRQNYQTYQNLIDAKTYQLQRVQRYLFGLQYPLKYNSDLITLNLLKKKQRIGEVTKHEVDLYQSINPSIRCHFNRTFSDGWQVPKLGLAIGAGLFVFGTIFNHSVPTRFMYFVSPIFADYFWSRRSPKSEVVCSQLFDWVFQYRKAKVFNERYHHLFTNPQTQKYIGNGNLTSLGDQLVKLTTSTR